MDSTQTPVTPIKQAMVVIAGHAVLAALLPDGRIAASFRMICSLLCLDHSGQMRRIQANSLIADKLILASMKVGGQQRLVYLIIAEAIPLWLKDVQINKVVPEARETLEEFQRVAVQTLRAFFFPETKAQQQSAPPKDEPTQSTLPPPEPEPFPPLGDEARYAYQDHMYLAHDGLERHLRAIDARLLTLTRQMADVQQVLNQHADVLNEHIQALLRHKEMLEQHREELRALATRVTNLEAARSLTLEHQVEVRTQMRALAHQTGQPTSALERELAAAFGVETVSQLSEAAWDEVAAWFHQRLGW